MISSSSGFWGRSPEPGATVATSPQGAYCHCDCQQVSVCPDHLAELAFSGLVLCKFTLCPLSVLRSWGESHAAHPQGYAAPLGGGIYKYRLFGILNGCSPILPHSLLYSITYMYHYRLMTIYFITWVITQYDFMLLLQWVQLWPRELCWPTPVCLWLPHHVGGGALPYFLELQGAPASSGAAPASALESDSSPGILVAPGGGIRHVIWCCVCLWLWDVQLLASPR